MQHICVVDDWKIIWKYACSHSVMAIYMNLWQLFKDIWKGSKLNRIRSNSLVITFLYT